MVDSSVQGQGHNSPAVEAELYVGVTLTRALYYSSIYVGWSRAAILIGSDSRKMCTRNCAREGWLRRVE
jgi:hypothetical protein